ncbi:MAG: phenylalanine--tRNA ligase subunit alpha [Proteobacteria bacterium]|nr:phenylalanine--tRNA ligase subunit alpha [Pseudomonadota bacterium]NDC24372.1 phenylalanine--tRNA ligase subunit alpha [Pseudomonadota bacterium]NDD04569.1 phenylalanine--tRNA ligase subunit alpha [Pseudomonadota bacterium]NDG26268.1 phenylalanine--tRNA ligase subunit alpha [Pseudomonadota bacterium]
MNDSIERIQNEARSEISSAPNREELERLRVHYVGKKGVLTSLLHQLKDLPADKRKAMGALLNDVKTEFENVLRLRQSELSRKAIEEELAKAPALDLSLSGQYSSAVGSLHPVTRVMEQFIQIMKRIGFSVATGPEVELDYYNFEALNTPEHHPARDMQDTFYIEPPILLRSHTSPVQIRTMKNKRPPLQLIAPGKVYRSDYDMTHVPMFHQIEGLMVDKHISFADLKGVLHYLVKGLFGARPLRFRPSYFPFTEPSAEVDMQCISCKGSGRDCRICKSTGWLEIGGCGMVHPNVFRAVGYDPDEISGFAFGMGMERIAMLKYGIDDIRSFFENDLRMLEQFSC